MKKLGFLVLLVSAALCSPAYAGKIVVNHDEWTLSNTGFTNAGGTNAATFATNVAAFFTGGGPGSFLAYSNNFGLTQSSLGTAMTGAGHTWTVDTSIAFDLATLLTFDGVFLGGFVGGPSYPNNGVLIDYVNAGGNVYVMGGTGNGGPVVEAGGWNAFLTSFGLAYALARTYNGVGGVLPTNSAHPIFAGVDKLYQNNGNRIVDQDPFDPRGVVFDNGLYAVFESTAAVPEPVTVALLGLGLAVLGFSRRRLH